VDVDRAVAAGEEGCVKDSQDRHANPLDIMLAQPSRGLMHEPFKLVACGNRIVILRERRRLYARKLGRVAVFQDTLYWSFLFEATVGHRMSVVAVAPIVDVEEAVGPTGEKIVGIFIMDAKNEHSQRVIIVHPELLALGFWSMSKSGSDPASRTFSTSQGRREEA
jgi:hypothetical protein